MLDSRCVVRIDFNIAYQTRSCPVLSGLRRCGRAHNQVNFMSLEMLEKLESKVQSAVDTISLLQMEIEELKEKNETLAMEAQELRSGREELVQDNEKLRNDHNAWQERVRNLLGKMDSVE